jgi:hypothetical protein
MARRHVNLPIKVRDPAPWTHGTHHPVRIVLHDTESHDTAGIADISGIFNFWHTQRINGELAKYGAHYIVDAEGLVGKGGADTAIQYHTGNLNTGSIGVEQVGFASFTRTIWSRKRRKQLFSVARVLAYCHAEYGIPLKVHTDPRLPGVTTHRRVGMAGIDTTGHTDPGAGYPIGLVVRMAKLIYHTNFRTATAEMPGKGLK